MTEKEKNELKVLLEMGHITQEYYDFMLADESQAAESKPNAGMPLPSPSTTPFLPPPDVAEWQISVNGKQSGPFNKSKLTNMLMSGELPRSFIVWKKGMIEWAKAGAVPELEEVFASLPPPTAEELEAEARAYAEAEIATAKAAQEAAQKAAEDEARKKAEQEAKIKAELEAKAEALIDSGDEHYNSYDSNRYGQAIADFTAALELQPDNSDILYKRGILYNNLNKYDLAIADFSELIDREPDNHYYFRFRASSYEGKGETDNAIADYEVVVKINPFDSNSKDKLNKLKRNKKRFIFF